MRAVVVKPDAVLADGHLRRAGDCPPYQLKDCAAGGNAGGGAVVDTGRCVKYNRRMKTGTEQLQYLFLLFPIVGVGLFVGGIAYRRRLKQRAAHCERTTGVVVDSVSGLAGGFDTSPVYRPVVEYFVGSTRFTFTGDAGYGRPKEKGTRLAVMFSPGNPAVAFVAEGYYFLAHMLLAIGGAFVVFGSVLAYHLLT